MKLINILKESYTEKERDMFEGFIESELTEEYPKNFNLEQFKNIRSYSGKVKYATQNLGKPIGNGSSRVVYRVDENKVLKLAKNEKGIAQNNTETDWSGDHYFSDILANVFDFDHENLYWVEMELAFKVTIKDFKRLWGVEFNQLHNYLNNKYSENNPYKRMFKYAISKEMKEILDNSDEVMQLVDFMFQTDSPPGDFAKKNSWGKVIRDGNENLVLIDFGLTNDVYNTYYG